MLFHLDGNSNTALGASTMYNDTNGVGNTAIGSQVMYESLTSSYNTAVGYKAMYNNTDINSLVAIGDSALFNNGIGATGVEATNNTAIGSKALAANTTGQKNTAVGFKSLRSNSSGDYNTAVGYLSLFTNSSGDYNIAAGYNALTSNSDGDYNTAIGVQALHDNSGGYSNTAIGNSALYSNQSGYQNTAIGRRAGYNSTGDGNVFIGFEAGYSATGDNKLYLDNDNNSIPLIFGDFSLRRIGLGTVSPGATLEIQSSGTTEDPFRVRVGSSTKLRVWSGSGSVSIGINTEGPTDGLLVRGDVVPRYHKDADLGADGVAWDNVYHDDLYNQGASAFEGRNLTDEILEHPPKPKKPGSFDYQTERGDVELDPGAMPEGLSDQNSLLTDEIASFNYKTNYEQQLQIVKLEQENETLRNIIADLEKRLSELESQ
jgi:hypothetical protein